MICVPSGTQENEEEHTMNVTETKTEDGIQLSIEGRVDTNTAPKLQEKVLQAFQKSSNVVIDMGGCGYMSSAGLRSLLIGHKTATSKGGSMKVCNVLPAVTQIFEVTGFAKILNIV